ncbi:DUF221-domain-containing protein [Nadsonia fulvescens var. elongata DSM 6958]|uniref:DUF221-domain-containing protein n=1 Tax=Nadsonia fulvescens var. elongata DSM 6958 TaxID=857566 RepID=A0A1E3PFZ1_9ASCO|nr:DUF221-domain-containing protein [Nadsonia fulvescens var. elongata DSM 6958]
MAETDSNKLGSSLQQMVTMMITNGIILAAFLIAYLLIRNYKENKRIYQPRSFVPTVPEELKTKPVPVNPIQWFKGLLTKPDDQILLETGLDGYFFVRYLRIFTTICLAGCLFFWPILFPINATGDAQGVSGLDILAFGKVNSNGQSNRFYAHVLMSWLFFGSILFVLYRELVYYVNLRQVILTSPAYASKASARTIMLASVPAPFLTEEGLRSLFAGVKHVWINRAQKELIQKVNERSKLSNKLEVAENKLIQMALKNKFKAEKKGQPIEGNKICDFVLDKKRPTHKLKFLIGDKVDTIDYAREKIADLNEEIAELQAHYDTAPPQNSAFIMFDTQEQAQTAFQVVCHHEAFHAAPRYIGIRPDEIVWSNARLIWWERLVKAAGALAFICALIIFWAVPVAFVGTISNIKYLTQKLPWLGFINNLPDVLLGLITALLPAILLAVLMALLPIILRLCAKIAGAPSKSKIEHTTQNYYFAFQVIQVFLITTISSTATAVIPKIIDNPSSAMNLLAEKLPVASNFYIAYFLLQGLTFPGGALLQIVPLILFKALGFIFDNTPRKKWTRYNILDSTAWGTIFPIYANLVVIALVYSTIAPLVLIFAALAFFLVYIAFLNNLTYTNMPSDDRGIYYPRAIYQTFTGIYLNEVCMLGLYVVSKSYGPIVLQAILLGVTVFVHINLEKAIDPLLTVLPRDMTRWDRISNGDKSSNDGAGKFSDTTPLMGDKSLYHDDSASHHPTDKFHDIDIEKTVEFPSGSNNTDNGRMDSNEGSMMENPESISPPKANAFMRFIQPYTYLSPHVLRETMLTSPHYHQKPAEIPFEEERLIYAHPAVNDDAPLIWIGKDPLGLGDTEAEQLNQAGVSATTTAAWFDIKENKKGKKKIEIRCGDLKEVPIWSGITRH